MLSFEVFALACLAATAWANTDQMATVPLPDGRIVGGYEAHISQFPHQVSMRYDGRHRCGGAIYSPTVIVSAAHCVIGTDTWRLSIVAGSTWLSENNAGVPVSKVIMHHSYKTYNNDYDAAILVLSRKLSFSQNVQPIALARTRPAEGAEVVVTGWGTTVEGGNIPDRLQQVSVKVVSNNQCKSAYSIMLTGRMLCAGVEKGGKDACQGDSGGPLIRGNTLVGIVSWGIGCAREGFPGVYASVAELHDWIKQQADANQ